MNSNSEVKTVVWVLLALTFLVVACATKPEPLRGQLPERDDVVADKYFYLWTTGGDDTYTAVIYRFIDDEAEVVCYVLYSDSISCLPIDQTNLTR
jgi:hypothetical protein